MHATEIRDQARQVVVSTSPSFGRRSRDPVALLETAGYEVRFLPPNDDTLGEALRVACAWIVGFETVDEVTLSGAGNLRVVAKCGAGLDNFDLDYLSGAGLEVVSVPGGNASAVAEYTMSQILALSRGTMANDLSVRRGEWGPKVTKGLDGSTIGIVGLGSIGRMLARMATAFEMSAVAFDPFVDDRDMDRLGVRPVNLEELLRISDFVTLHLPLNAETRNLICKDTLALMRRGSYLINNSRGGIVDEKALVAALSSGHLAGAALDVFEVEPLIAESDLFSAPNLILSSHTAGYSDTTLNQVTLSCATSVLQALST